MNKVTTEVAANQTYYLMQHGRKRLNIMAQKIVEKI